MSHTVPTHEPSFSLLTDLYQLTMACAYWRAGIAEHEAVFDLLFRSNPFGGGFSIACGTARIVRFLQNLEFDERDTDYLGGLKGNNDQPLFDEDFLKKLRNFEFHCNVDAVPEGTIVFPNAPLVRVQGPLWQTQLFETALLNIINFETLIATKAARVTLAAQGDPVLEFGLRRAQGVDGGLSASRAAYVGGCAATSNVLAGKRFDIPVKGTHAHSWVMAFASETESFEAYADAMPHNSIMLVDTYDTREGVRRAIDVGKKLRERGYPLAGIRLDSGDLCELSIDARRMLDEAGFEKAGIVGSGDLDEHEIARLKKDGAKIGIWGVGTKLATAYDEPALGGVYKLSAIRKPGEPWQYKVKLSERKAKMSNPGILQVRRFHRNGTPVGDVVYDIPTPPDGEWTLVDSDEQRITMPEDATSEDLLVPLFRDGKAVYQPPTATQARERAMDQLRHLDDRFKRVENPEKYPAGLEQSLFERKMKIVDEIRKREIEKG